MKKKKMNQILRVHRPNGNVSDVEVNDEMSCYQAAHLAAFALGYPVFESPWALSLAATNGPTLSWIHGSILIKELSSYDVFVSTLPMKEVLCN